MNHTPNPNRQRDGKGDNRAAVVLLFAALSSAFCLGALVGALR